MNSKSRKSVLGNALLLNGLFLALAVVLAAFQTARAASIFYAAPTAQGSGDCSSWANACPLQTALTGASSGNEIWVQAGVHYPGSNRTDTFALQSGVAVYGGFAGTETGRDQRDPQAQITILSGDIDQNDLTDPYGVVTDTANIQGENAYHVVTGSGTDGTAALDGFIITAGQANGDTPDNYGAGMYNFGGGPTLANVSFSGNSAWFGGGIYNEQSSPTLTNVNFNGNSAFFGGGLLNIDSNSSPTLIHVTFSGNSANSGAGMANYGNPTLTDVIFSSNSADLRGGGMINIASNPTLTNVTFNGNSALNGGGMKNEQSNPTLTNVAFGTNSASRGGGMHNSESSPTLINVTLSGNSADPDGGGMYNFFSSPALTNAILWGNTAPNGADIYNDGSTPLVSTSDIQGCGGSGSWNSACGTDGGGNIEADPLFVDAANGNLRLQITSPAIDAGNNAALPPDILTDLDGKPRFVDVPTVPDTGIGTPPIVDMGAYEVLVDVTLSKAALPPMAAPGEAITFTLTLTNAGSLPATGIRVTDTLPTLLWGVSFTSTLTVTDTGSLPPFVWLVQDLAPDQGGLIAASGMLTVPLAAGIYTNTAFISAAVDLLAENNSALITFTVPNVAPVFTSAPVITATQDAPYTYTATAQDDNGDALTLTAPTLPAWLTLADHGDGTATLAGTPGDNDVGEHLVVLCVTDSAGALAEQEFVIIVAERPRYIYLPFVFRNWQP